MAVSDWNTVASENHKLGGIELNGSFGAVVAELMAQIKAKMDGTDTALEAQAAAIGEWTGGGMDEVTLRGAIETLGGSVDSVENTIGSWTDTTEETTLCAAIEALRPSDD